MTPDVSAEPSSALDCDHRARPIGDRLARGGIIAALLEALNAPERFQLINVEGEFFLEPAFQL